MNLTVTVLLNGAPVPFELDKQAITAIAAAVGSRAEPAQPESPYFSIVEAAAYLRCSRQRIDDLLSARRLSRFKDGSRTLVSRAEIERYVNPC